MNIFDVLLFMFTGFLLIMFLREKEINKRHLIALTLSTALIFLLYTIFGFVRWQLYPIYFIFLIAILLLINQYFKLLNVKKAIEVSLNVLFIVAFILSVFAVLSFPVYEIPNPSGDYDIGTSYDVIEDTSREELYSDAPYRKIMIQLWYPAETTEGYERAPWLEGGQKLSRALASDNYLPAFALDHSVYVMSNSYYDAPISEDSQVYPVIIISHGWRGFRTLHTDFAEELASQGYIVVSIDHTYGSVATVFGEDDVAYLNLDALPPRETNPNFLDDANQLVYTYSHDIISTLDYLEEINDGSGNLGGKLNLGLIGLLGHSTGGGAGVATALMDDRIDAVFGLDSWVEPIGHDILSDGLDVPSAFLRSGSWETGENNAYLYTLIENSTETSKLYQINGTTHLDFAMVYMYSPLTKYIGLTGSVDSDELTEILKSTIKDFFSSALIYQNYGGLYIGQWDEVAEIQIP